jgi:hypothetical protein
MTVCPPHTLSCLHVRDLPRHTTAHTLTTLSHLVVRTRETLPIRPTRACQTTRTALLAYLWLTQNLLQVHVGWTHRDTHATLTLHLVVPIRTLCAVAGCTGAGGALRVALLTIPGGRVGEVPHITRGDTL